MRHCCIEPNSVDKGAFWKSLKNQQCAVSSYSGVQLGLAKTDAEISGRIIFKGWVICVTKVRQLGTWWWTTN